jgi:hypothetical protein
MSLEVSSIINHFVEKNETKWEKCTGLCTDGIQSISGRNAELQALVRNKATHIIWTRCILHRQPFGTIHISEKLWTLFQSVVKIVNYAKNSPLRGRLTK